jgi:hypothetical protein
LNENGYSFDQDFDILSVGSVDGNDDGYWGSGNSIKNIIDHGNGNIEYQLLASSFDPLTGTYDSAEEPHGTIQFKGAFDEVTWTSLSDETWNGFTVGIQGTAKVVFPVPEPSTLAIFSLALMGLASRKVKQKS